MERKETLTNEKIKSKFKSQFDLVNYAIRLAENVVHTGRGPRVKMDTDNIAQQVVEEIVAGKDKFEEYTPQEKVEAYELTSFSTLSLSKEDFSDEDDEDDEDEDTEKPARKQKKRAKKVAVEE